MTAPTIPTSPDELRATLEDDAKVQSIFENGGLAEFVKNYAEAFAKKDKEFSEELDAKIQQGIAEFLKEHDAEPTTNRLDLRPGNPTAKVPGGADAPGAKVDQAKLFGSDADFIRATWHRNNDPKALQAQDKLREIRNSYGSTIPSDGGFLIPETLRANLLQVALEMAVVRPRATVVPMDSLRVPFPTIDDTSHESSVFGGMIGYWTEEGGALTESEASFGRVVLEALKLTGYSEVPNELFGDSVISFSAFLNQVWPQAIAFFEDIAFLTGSGTGEPLGVLNADAAVTTQRATASEVNFADIANMYARMLPSSLNRAVWLASPAVIAQLLQMDTGTGGVPLWLQGGNAMGSVGMSLLGRPLIVSEKVSDLGTEGDLDFVDFGYYLLGDRQAMSMDTSPHYKFKNDVTAVRIIERVDGRPWLQSAITPNNGGSTLSPVVKLTDAA